MLVFIVHKYVVTSLCLSAVFFSFSCVIGAEARDTPYEELKDAVAKMACRIPPQDRHAVAVLDPVVTPKGLQACVATPVVEAIMQVLYEFQFTLIERSFVAKGFINRSMKMRPSSDVSFWNSVGAKAVFKGTVTVKGDAMCVTYRLMKLDTNRIIGMLTCRLPKTVFADCFLAYDLLPPTPGMFLLLPNPRRIR